jgi:dienelactone hydrolase
MPKLSFKRRHLIGASLAVSAWAAGAWKVHANENFKIQSPERLRVLDLNWQDRRRDRFVPVRLYLPVSASPSSPVPLVVFSHGIGGSRFGYSYLGRAWANEGFASLHLQHVGSDRQLWLNGSPIQLVERLREAARESEVVARVADLRFALDQALGGELGAFFDNDRIVVAGHSYGANTALLAAGARVERQGRLLDLNEPRVKAAVVISAPPFYGEPSPSHVLASVQVPSLHITATDDVIFIPGYFSALTDRIEIYENVGSAKKLLAVFSGGSHSIFTDRVGTGGWALNPRVKEATRSLTLAFFKSVLHADNSKLHEWPQRHGSLLADYRALG